MTFSVELGFPDEINSEGHVVEIYIDDENLNQLIQRLQVLRQKQPIEEFILMSESWGMHDLTEVTHKAGNIITHSLRFTLVEK